MTEEQLQKWFKLTDDNKRNIFDEISNKMGIPAFTAEKDWWVVCTLDIIFQTSIKDFVVFKGGTSLSKSWNLIKRFSEDIDLVLDRKFLEFGNEMSKSQITKLRKKFCKFVSDDYVKELTEEFEKAGFTGVNVKLQDLNSSDNDPLKIEIIYAPLTEGTTYLQSRVTIEIGCRSLIEPHTSREIISFVGEEFKGRDFADTAISIPSVNPERTFLEKIFLLHEEFQKDRDRIRVNRMSRHLYDLEKLMDTEFAKSALENEDLYNEIVEHREKFSPVKGVDYLNHSRDKINILPPPEKLSEWENDYNSMVGNMMYGYSIPFNELIDRITELQNRINT